LNFIVLEYILILAIISESITGALSAGKKGMDPVGVIIIAFTTSLGGGVIRDVFLDNYPLLWVRRPELFWLCVTVALTTVLIKRYLNNLLGIFLIMDAIGVTSLSIIGTNIAMKHDHGVTVSMVCALATGVFGGVLRDTLCNDVPWVFKKELYATVCATCSILYYCAIKYTDFDPTLVIFGILIFGVAARLVALKYRVGWPVFCYEPSQK